MKKNLLVTLADKNYILQAKQLFSSVYWNAGWKGDYMLLSHEIPEKELRWFRKKGILVKKCKSLIKTKKGNYPSLVLDKFYLFTKEFKKWKTIIYLDSDIIVRGSLDELTKVKEFAAVKDIYENPISTNFKENEKKDLEKLRKTYLLEKKGFASGVFAFNSNIINKKLQTCIKRIINKYSNIANGDQPLFNLVFYNKIKFLPCIFNFYIPNCSFIYLKIAKRKEPIIIHLSSTDKPWNKFSPFYTEWKSNLNKADLIDLSKTLMAKNIIKKNEINIFENYLKNLEEKIIKNQELAELYRKGDYKNYRKQLLKSIKEDGPLFWKREIFYYFAGFFPKNIKNKLKKLLN